MRILFKCLKNLNDNISFFMFHSSLSFHFTILFFSFIAFFLCMRVCVSNAECCVVAYMLLNDIVFNKMKKEVKKGKKLLKIRHLLFNERSFSRTIQSFKPYVVNVCLDMGFLLAFVHTMLWLFNV